MAPLLTRVGRRRQRVWLGSRVGFLGQTGTHVPITAWSTTLSFGPLLSSFMLFCLVSPRCFLSPPRRPCGGICLISVLLRPCGGICLIFVLLRPCGGSSNTSFLSTNHFRLSKVAFLISFLRQWYSDLFHSVLLIVFSFFQFGSCLYCCTKQIQVKQMYEVVLSGV